MNEYYYLAYGSNLSMRQMAHRCPDAVPVGLAKLEGYRLVFRGSGSGNYLSVDSEPGSGESVECLVWRVTQRDIVKLDAYEGFPEFYTRFRVPVSIRPFIGEQEISVGAFAYALDPDEHALGLPTASYLNICREGYQRFGVSEDAIRAALLYSAERKGRKRAEILWKRSDPFEYEYEYE